MVCCSVELRFPKRYGGCHASSTYPSVKPIYLKEASQLDRPVQVPEATVPVTLKLPPRTVERLRQYVRSSGLTIGAIVTGALNAFLHSFKRHG